MVQLLIVIIMPFDSFLISNINVLEQKLILKQLCNMLLMTWKNQNDKFCIIILTYTLLYASYILSKQSIKKNMSVNFLRKQAWVQHFLVRSNFLNLLSSHFPLDKQNLKFFSIYWEAMKYWKLIRKSCASTKRISDANDFFVNVNLLLQHNFKLKKTIFHLQMFA